MMKAYLASSLKNYRLNYTVSRILESKGISCFLPQRDALEKSLKNASENNHEAASKIRNRNVSGITSADMVLAIAKNLGADSAWECGFAAGLGKLVILIRTPQDPIEDVYMLFNSLEHVIKVPKYEVNELKQAINSLDFDAIRRRRIGQ
jgi:nucleoside 2-deoxyribosyltransferase